MGSPVHICVAQETHWSLDSEWQTDQHHCVHSGFSKRQAGILIMIDKSFVSASAICTHTHIPGRLVQVRLEKNPAITLFVVYQFVWSEAATAQGEDSHLKREEVWSALHSAVRGTPWRSQLLVAGDFNTPCIPEPPFAGNGVPALSAIRQSDQTRFQTMLSMFSLNVLNSWQRRKHAYTYRFQRQGLLQQTQIDFILMRHGQADQASRCARPLLTPFVSTQGMYHLPVLASVLMPARPQDTPAQGPRLTASTVNATLRDHPHLATSLAAQVQQQLESMPTLSKSDSTLASGEDADPADVVNKALLRAWQAVTTDLPRQGRAVGTQPHSPGLVRQLWTLRRLRQAAPATFSVLRGWLQAAKLARLQRRLRKICRNKKKEKVELLLQEAAASPHLSVIYSVVRRLAPKSRHRRLQLRDANGILLSPQQESEAIADFFRGVYGSRGWTCPPCAQPIQGVSFELSDLIHSLQGMQQSKALPQGFAPARLWKDHAAIIAPTLLPAINLSQGVLHNRWHEVQVCTLPKAAIVKLPKQVRPISLLHPCNKVLASMLAESVLPKVVSFLNRVPQWAYLPGRSTADSIEAVCAHLHQVRELVAANSTSILQRFRGSEPVRLVGGISISLDVHKAYDSLPHPFLRESMQAASFTQDEIDLVMHLHSQADMQFGLSPHIAHAYLSSGIRQGCSLSPLLWSLSTGHIYHKYMQLLQADRLTAQTASLYADDAFSSWIFRIAEDFRKAVRATGLLIQALQEAGLQLSVDKTVILLSATGTSLQSVLSGYRHEIEGVPHFRVRVGKRTAFDLSVNTRT